MPICFFCCQLHHDPHSRLLRPNCCRYDYVYAPSATTAAVYESCVLPLLSRALEGYNVTIFAYVPLPPPVANNTIGVT